MPNQLFAGLFYHSTPNACVVDLTPPTFTGITSAIAQGNGSIKVNFPAATDATTPVRYRVYIALGSVSAAALFVSSNVVSVVEPSGSGPFSTYIYTLSDLTTYLAINQIYTFGVRAVDAVGNMNTNTVIDTEASFGVLPDCLVAAASSLAATQVLLDADHVAFQSDHTNFQNDHTNFQTDHTNISAQVALFTTQVGLLTTQVSAITATEILLANDITVFNSQLTTLNGYLITLAADLATFTTQNNTFISSNATLTSLIASLNTEINDAMALVAALQALALSQSVSGTALEASASEFTMDVTLDEETIP